MFYAALRGREHGNIDFLYDPEAREQITVGKIEHRDDRSYFDVWTSFPARSFRTGRRKPFRTPIALSDFRITAELDTELRLKADAPARQVEELVGHHEVQWPDRLLHAADRGNGQHPLGTERLQSPDVCAKVDAIEMQRHAVDNR